MNKLLKIIVTDSAGEETVFEETDDVQNHFERSIYDADGTVMPGWIRIITRTFSTKKTFDTETISEFFNPRKVELLFGKYEP